MHWSRELLALTAGVRWRIAGLVANGFQRLCGWRYWCVRDGGA
jgi:hypothetical protein